MLRDCEKRKGPSTFALVLMFLFIMVLSPTDSHAGQITEKDKKEFFKAVEAGDLEKVKVFVNDEPEFLKVEDRNKRNILSISSGNGYHEIIKFCISKGCNPNLKDGSGKTPLYYAAMADTLETIKLLLSYGADIKKENPIGVTLLYKALLYNDEELIDYLISVGVNVQTKDKNGSTPLICAIHWSNNEDKEYSIVSKLLNAGAGVNQSDRYGNNPLDMAAFEGALKTVNLLESKGARFGRPGIVGPIHLAASGQNYKVFKYYVEKGFDINRPDSEGNTPLHYAVTESLLASNHRSVVFSGGTYPAIKPNMDLLRLLESKGVRVDSRNGKGRQPIHLAIDSPYYVKEKIKIINFLISSGADVNAADNEGNTPLFYPIGKKEIAEALVAKGADVNVRNRRGETPLYNLISDYNSNSKDIMLYFLSKDVVPGPAEVKLIYESKNWKVIPIIFTYSRPLQIGVTISIILLTTILFLLFRNRRKKIPATGDESDKSTDEINTVKGV